ncbi:hypothetical protein A3K34_03090 [candidate division WWE3 bacterium RIFOXYC1_FULL_40_10]|uniref:Glycosyltransferase RgtA/B/C/D-like domain-containing protein n=1 Tax=candidate division WWE3 bacterium RIFOXYA2_FULL_46_9 TaxID=1802636 RepID=A0A1F4W0H5_UNCKA|nr:MAG: hypothetical protein A3K58_03090 [candidate division WWE3 bacterium RIFOXYB1_FULL_40_22]OGC61833.1 MAG: hypothetical protein A3K37_03090 [candidate division WWE3 bacterium RIFOXYA1_FULL_40_11]OGC62850.1 MAG: hypothetical protein A2264_04250 [candidate division WWE3 bacterium RIFOXYA2_FULL_46_9]OGC64305.1 MAG: hypothetical protein A2326_00505 [candidate division WWE3 bacterium RIFOXYB2_FULL_41_6]OGC66216.1 MAG: hypothetical protein A3K34_03090 [candidate division WWE3 bacterium RIFOXYC1_
MKQSRIFLLIILVFVLSRLPMLGKDIFNTDALKWKARSYDFSTGVFTLNFEKTIQKYHPGVTLMWVGTAGIKLFNGYYSVILHQNPPDNLVSSVFQLHFTQKFLLVIVIGIGLAFAYLALTKIFDKKTALLAILLLGVEPLYLALTRVFHLEGMMSTFMLVSILYFYCFLLRFTTKDFVISAVFAGFSVLTKTSALFLLPFVGLVLGMSLFVDFGGGKKKLVKVGYYFSLWLVVFLVTFVVAWPAMWTHPQLALQTMYRGISEIGIEDEHFQFYFGSYVSNPGLTFYFVVLLLRASFWTLIGFVGAILVFRKLDIKEKKVITYLGLFVFFYFIQLTIPTKKLDRYILPNLMVITLISSFFYNWLLAHVQIKPNVKTACLVIFGLCVILFYLPDYLSHYNPLFGGLKTGIYVIEPKWMIGIQEVKSYFKREMKRNNIEAAPKDFSLEKLIGTGQVKNTLVVAFPEKYYTQVQYFIRDIGGWATIYNISAQSRYATYFVFPIWDDSGPREDRFKLEFVDTIKVRGVDVYKVYKKV